MREGRGPQRRKGREKRERDGGKSKRHCVCEHDAGIVEIGKDGKEKEGKAGLERR